MSIESFIKKVCVQDVVYWGNPTPTGTGGYSFDQPVQIKCRWDEYSELTREADGKEFVCKAKLLVTQDLSMGGYLKLGTLDDLSESEPDPVAEPEAYFIGKKVKVPLIKSSTKFVRTVYIGYQQKG